MMMIEPDEREACIAFASHSPHGMRELRNFSQSHKPSGFVIFVIRADNDAILISNRGVGKNKS